MAPPTEHQSTQDHEVAIVHAGWMPTRDEGQIVMIGDDNVIGIDHRHTVHGKGRKDAASIGRAGRATAARASNIFPDHGLD